MINYWWVTRPKRKLNSVPDVLAVFSQEALNQVWDGQRGSHLSLEDALEKSGLKRIGDRRDHTGGGGRTYKAWLKSLGLIFNRNGNKQLCLTLAGEAIMNGESPVKILTNQVLKYQFPSSFSIGRGVQLNPRFKIHPFWFLLKLLSDSRIDSLSTEEIAKIVITEAENESDKCYEYIVRRICQFRETGDRCLGADFFKLYSSSKGAVNPDHPYSHLIDVANTIINWLEYTQLICRDNSRIAILDDEKKYVQKIVGTSIPFIPRPIDEEFFQRRYGLDPNHLKDTRNLNKTQTITAELIAEHQVKQAYIGLSLKQPICHITSAIVDTISESTGIKESMVEAILQKNYPHGSIGSFLSSYFEMAFKGREECRDFEIATTNIFSDVFGFRATHIAGGAKEVPDVLLVSNPRCNYQAIIDTKAYNRYDLGATHRDRMIYHYIPDIHKYGDPDRPLAFFTYVAGGFSPTIDTPLNKIVTSTGTNGSAITVSTIIKMVEQNDKLPYTHGDLRNIFSVNRKVLLSDIISNSCQSCVAEDSLV